MDTLIPQQPENPIAELPKDSTAEQLTLPTWHKPIIIRIDIKRTMNTTGSGGDFMGATV
ncbi:MAG: hypothetical protein HZC38_18205 [Chloroflexi bacterium]|nr:hypothetical protein [Chloroflexota bacterium]